MFQHGKQSYEKREITGHESTLIRTIGWKLLLQRTKAFLKGCLYKSGHNQMLCNFFDKIVPSYVLHKLLRFVICLKKFAANFFFNLNYLRV